MSNELELAAGVALTGLSGRAPKADGHAPGTPCANCATPLQGPWCHVCGQSAEDFHRSIVKLTGEVIEGVLHADGRLWRTLPDLMFRPGRLTRAYLEGHRAPQIPPLRLFLVVLLAIFLVGGLTSSGKPSRPPPPAAAQTAAKAMSLADDPRTISEMTPAERAIVKGKLKGAHVVLGGDRPNAAATNWLNERLNKAIDDPERFFLILEQWSERFAFLMLPISAIMLSLLFVFQRRFYLFDHTIFSLHSLSAMGVVLTLAMLLNTVIGGWGFALMIPAPLHLFGHMRGVYRTSVLGTLIRMTLLFVGSVTAGAVLIVGLIAVGLNGMGG